MATCAHHHGVLGNEWSRRRANAPGPDRQRVRLTMLNQYTSLPWPARFWAKVDQSGEGQGCWEWTGQTDADGYGHCPVPGVGKRTAHRTSYELTRNHIPDGLQIDHLCRNRSCVNPAHLEPVTAKENTMRGHGPAALNAAKIACIHGHPLVGENLYVCPRGKRECRECRRANMARWSKARRLG